MYLSISSHNNSTSKSPLKPISFEISLSSHKAHPPLNFQEHLYSLHNTMPAFPRINSRTFSALSRVRTALSLDEAHPFGRYPVTQRAAKADWGRQFRHLGSTAMVYFPFYAVILGWPVGVGYLLNGHMWTQSKSRRRGLATSEPTRPSVRCATLPIDVEGFRGLNCTYQGGMARQQSLAILVQHRVIVVLSIYGVLVLENGESYATPSASMSTIW